MNKKFQYSKEKLVDICNKSYSYRQCLTYMGLKPAGGNYACLKNKIKEYEIDISHFTLQGWSKGKKIGPKRCLSDYLNNKQTITSWKLKKRLLQENIFQHRCYQCNKKTWLNQKIPLELHHKDGNNLNNNLSNLVLLCPNCHALTENYRSKNRK